MISVTTFMFSLSFLLMNEMPSLLPKIICNNEGNYKYDNAPEKGHTNKMQRMKGIERSNGDASKYNNDNKNKKDVEVQYVGNIKRKE